MSQLARWSAVVDGAYAAALGERDWRAVISDIETAFGAAGATIFDVDLAAGGVVDMVTNQLAPAAGEYVDRMNAINPRMLWSLKQPNPHVVADYDTLPEAALCRHEFYDWLTRECGVKYYIGSRMVDDGPIRSYASVDFTARHGHADEAEMELFRRMVPHIANAWRLAGKLKVLELKNQAASEAAERASIGIVGLRADGRVVSVSEEALRVLRAEDGLCIRDGLLHADRAATDRGLQAALGQAIRSALGEADTARTTLAVPRRSGLLDYVLEVAPFARRYGRQPYGQPMVFVFVTDPMAGGVTSDALRRLYGLSPREAELAMLLERGMALGASAAAMNIAYNTARVHLASVLRKTGTESRAELVRLLGRVRPLASAGPAQSV